MVVAATAENADQALTHALALNPDLILLDTGLPDGIGIVASLAGAVPDIPVVALAVADTEHAVLAWAEAGVAGYVHRSASIVELIDTARLVMRGEQTCSARIAGAMLRRLRQLAATARREEYATIDVRLTPREREIAHLVAHGLSNKLIAQRLHIEVATTKCHVHNILDKLNLHCRSDLARWVREYASRLVCASWILMRECHPEIIPPFLPI
jgi:DNA-binding NarL/FixJ family response regulator